MSASLVGSEMCIRDRLPPRTVGPGSSGGRRRARRRPQPTTPTSRGERCCLLYTSDAADDM
eukprot:4922769-Alexandrium_andersonii.AAC.1